MPKPEQPRPKGKSRFVFDPSELEDLIHTPAVGMGVSSHLLSWAERTGPEPNILTTVAKIEQATVVTGKLTTVDTQDVATVVETPIETQEAGVWRTEAGSLIIGRAISPVRQTGDVLSDTEKRVVDFLAARGFTGPAGCILVSAGYDEIGKATGLSRRSVQRTIARLRDKDVLLVEQPADIYTRTPTLYRLCDEAAVMDAHERRGRRYVARIGPGTVYVFPVVR